MKEFNINTDTADGELIIHLVGDNATYEVIYDHGQIVFQRDDRKYIIPENYGHSVKFFKPDPNTGKTHYALSAVRSLYRDTTPTDFGINDILDMVVGTSKFTEEIVVGGTNEKIPVIAPSGVTIYVNGNAVASGSHVNNGDVVKFELEAGEPSQTTQYSISVGDITKLVNVTTLVLDGEEEFTTPGTYSWTCPAGVTSVSVVAIGGGGAGEDAHDGASGYGGALAYKNNISVVPGQSYTVVVGAGGSVTQSTSRTNSYGGNGGNSYITVNGTNYALAQGGRGGTGVETNRDYIPSYAATYSNADGGGLGGLGLNYSGTRSGGGGAGGYSGQGGRGGCYQYVSGNTNFIATAGQGGAGGGGEGSNGGGSQYASGGGGTGIYGIGSNGAQSSVNGYAVSAAKGGSGGANGIVTAGSNNIPHPNGGGFGGGGAGGNSSDCAGLGAGGAVRIIWGNRNGNAAAFPSNATKLA